ncbi:Aminoglycoside phosphotransferase [Cordyceps fumosorosea ARSEF 2679]|uniref:Aminoglycoside phosphotransferase n=1 Tax=Cordyceps fumosorosea (strain ARSEF 2679) TaxID=1081104 RepID=A0A167I8E3_CORFA|nr:Aminoglycoside phosphotransferase [Cordyceps fumosorosea ARSEF 2679]OAA48783.1 Aminoglycoside phosphotransferase [Cordyceps fumosorosea ARSEF 2679]
MLPNDSSQEPSSTEELEQPPREHWAGLPEFPRLSGPTMPAVGRQFFKHSPTTILKLGTDNGEGIMTALAYAILGPCVPRVISIVTIPVTNPDAPALNHTSHGVVLSHQPGTPLVQLWPSLTAPQREAIKAELCRLLVRMRSRRFCYYGRPTRESYRLFSEFGTEIHPCCASRSEWDDSRVQALRKHAPSAERAADLERVQRGTVGAEDWDRPVLTHADLSDRNILVDPDTLAVTGFLDWEMANIAPAYFEYTMARLSGGHEPEWRKEVLDVLRAVLRSECDADERRGDLGAESSDDRYSRTLAAWDAVVDVERFAQDYDDACYWTFEH